MAKKRQTVYPGHHDGVIPHALLLQLSALLRSLPAAATTGIVDEFGAPVPTPAQMDRQLRAGAFGPVKRPAPSAMRVRSGHRSVHRAAQRRQAPADCA